MKILRQVKIIRQGKNDGTWNEKKKAPQGERGNKPKEGRLKRYKDRIKQWFKPRIIPRGTERMPQGHQRNSRVTIHWSTYSQGQQNETGKSSYGVDRLQKSIWYGPTKLDNRLP